MFNATQLNTIISILTAWGAAFLVALWLGLIFWTYRDISTRGKENFMRILAVLLVGLLFLPGMVIYLIIRPRNTLEEEYQKALEEEALLAALDDVHKCPGCDMRIQEKWMICPTCHTQLKKICKTCRNRMEMGWDLCAFCGTPVPGMKVREAEDEEDEMEDLSMTLPSTRVSDDFGLEELDI